MSHALQGIVIFTEICPIAGFWSMLTSLGHVSDEQERTMMTKELTCIKIDNRIYALYGPTEEEIRIVERE